MQISTKTSLLSMLAFTLLLLSACSPSGERAPKDNANPTQPTLGEISIDVTCNEEATKKFQEGLLFLHSFQFDDAAEKFAEAQNLDNDCAMAYWGEAMSENHPLWREKDRERAMEILHKLGGDKAEIRARFKTEFEKDMLDAIWVLYGKGTKNENDRAYAAVMADLHKKYPDNHEVRAFHALSLLGSAKKGRDEKLYNEGAKIAQSIIEENPNHPGALHYLIHSYDDPYNASKALDAANRYAKVAPDAAHALHMPSHIYVALGMWDEVIKSNIAAVAASIERRERKGLDLSKIDFHSLKWRMYGHLQKGEFAEARKLVQQMEDYCEKEYSPKAVSHTVMMKGAYLTETGKWDDELVEDDIDYEDLPIQIYGTRCFIQGMAAYQANDLDSIKRIISGMDPDIAEARKKALAEGSSMCSGSYNRSMPTETNVQRTEVVQIQLQALVAMAENKSKEAEELLKQAITKEEETTYKYGPPEIVKPTHEMYAEWLEKNNRPKEALNYYQKVLDRAPGRYIPTQAIKKLEEAE